MKLVVEQFVTENALLSKKSQCLTISEQILTDLVQTRYKNVKIPRVAFFDFAQSGKWNRSLQGGEFWCSRHYNTYAHTSLLIQDFLKEHDTVKMP